MCRVEILSIPQILSNHTILLEIRLLIMYLSIIHVFKRYLPVRVTFLSLSKYKQQRAAQILAQAGSIHLKLTAGVWELALGGVARRIYFLWISCSVLSGN